MKPIIDTLYKYFLKYSEYDFVKRTVIFSFLFEGFGGPRALEFVKKYSISKSELSNVARSCRTTKSGKVNIKWDLIDE